MQALSIDDNAEIALSIDSAFLALCGNGYTIKPQF